MEGGGLCSQRISFALGETKQLRRGMSAQHKSLRNQVLDCWGRLQGLSEPRKGEVNMVGWVVRECSLEEVGYSRALGSEKSTDNHRDRY